MKKNKLIHALVKGDVHTVHTLVYNEAADVHVLNKRKDTPLHLAAANGHQKVVDTLISAGAHVNVPNDRDETPLHLAAADGQQQITDTLIGAGAHVDACNDVGDTPLHIASPYGHQDIVRTLIDNGADVNVTNAARKTPLHVVCASIHNVFAGMQQYHIVSPHSFKLIADAGSRIAQMLIASGAEIKDLQDETIALLLKNNLKYADLVRRLRDAKDIRWTVTESTTPQEMCDYVALVIGQSLSYKLDEFADDAKYKMFASVWNKAREYPVPASVLTKLLHTYPSMHQSLRLNYGDTPAHIIARGECPSNELSQYVSWMLAQKRYDLRNNNGDTPQDIADTCGNRTFLQRWNYLLDTFACLTNTVPLDDATSHVVPGRTTRRTSMFRQTSAHVQPVPQDIAIKILAFLDV